MCRSHMSSPIHMIGEDPIQKTGPVLRFGVETVEHTLAINGYRVSGYHRSI